VPNTTRIAFVEVLRSKKDQGDGKITIPGIWYKGDWRVPRPYKAREQDGFCPLDPDLKGNKILGDWKVLATWHTHPGGALGGDPWPSSQDSKDSYDAVLPDVEIRHFPGVEKNGVPQAGWWSFHIPASHSSGQPPRNRTRGGMRRVLEPQQGEGRPRRETDQTHGEVRTPCGPKAQPFSQRRATPW
jgi:hypothetical protein